MKPEIIYMLIAMGLCLLGLMLCHTIKIIYYIMQKKEEEKRIELFKKNK